MELRRTYLLLVPLFIIGSYNKGELHINFNVAPSEVDVYASDNMDTPIITKTMNGKDMSLMLSLNIGNYIVKPFASGCTYGLKGVQVHKGKKSTLKFP